MMPWHLLFFACSIAGFSLLNDTGPVSPYRSPEPPIAESQWIKPNIIRLPFRLSGALITVQAKVDTLEGTFIFDTGASNLLLNYRYFGQNGVASESGGVTGKVRIKGNVVVDSLIMDNLEGRNIPADLIDLSHIERAKKIRVVGIIGFKVFEDYEILFDYSASVLTMVRLNEKGIPFEKIPAWEYVPIDNFPLVVKGHIAILTLKFGKKKKLFGLDSGAEQNLLDLKTGKSFLKDNFTVLKRVKLRGAGQNSVEVLTGNLSNATLDTFNIRPMATILTNMRDINTIYETNLQGILGYEFLSQMPMSINYKKRRLTFYKSVFLQP